MDRDRSISRAGNPRARTTLIQLAWLWLRYQPGSALAAWFRERVGTRRGRTRRIAIVAMARKLLIALWRYVETGVTPDGVEFRAEADVTAVIKRIAAKRRRRQRQYGERDRLLLWWPIAAAFQVGRVSPGQRLVHEAFWCGAVLPRPHVR